MEKLKASPKKIIEMSTANMNIQSSKKYGFSPEEVQRRALESERFRIVYNMHKWKNQRQDRYHKKKYSRKRKKLRENLNIGEKVYMLAERIKKKSAPAKFYKHSVQNISCLNKDTVFTIKIKTNHRRHKILLVKKSNSEPI